MAGRQGAAGRLRLARSRCDGSRASRARIRERRLNATHRPRTLLSGLLFCGCCGGSYARRGQDRYACTNHVLSGGCDNSPHHRPQGIGSPRAGRAARAADGAGDRGRGHARLCGGDQPAQPRAPHSAARPSAKSSPTRIKPQGNRRASSSKAAASRPVRPADASLRPNRTRLTDRLSRRAGGHSRHPSRTSPTSIGAGSSGLTEALHHPDDAHEAADASAGSSTAS